MAAKDDVAEEKALGKIIAGKLQEQLQSEPTGCPDMETLSAYYDRTLAPSERTVCESHLMTCSRCQIFIAELARLSEADEPPVIVGDVEIERAEEPRWHFRLAWIMPVLAVLIVGGVWYGEKIRNYIRPPEETAVEESPPETTRPAQEAEKGRERRAPATLARRSEGEAGQGAREEKKEQVAAAASPTRAPGSGITIKGAAPETTGGGAAGGIAAPSERQRLATSTAETRVLQIPTGPQAGEAADHAVAAAVPSSPAAATGTSAPAGRALAKQEAAEKPSALTNYTIQGYTPAYHPKWRVGRGGLIQKYDAERGWIDVPSGVQVDLFDVTFSNASVGWIVGHEGTVLRTTDGGTNWSRVSSPSSEDLVRVSAIGNRKAQVMSRSGRAFVTNDAGRSWTPVGEP